ncbi:MAG: hypothetical protein A2381_16280 [Bdellovibrionales bacterium RIFOXYB1_FULL_37_110]|nr:MAG: hypothetical protein A2181_06385 [Bdellovibrionales bacterium RIFOXYA1_FULL_38_20]OFZ48499.1 MAG: hypothetical protein A2417_04140 [Bdellovibrionales bacterium RIFOXYC1_FULL_37_79]OFZ57178.1 MAG: hypothetical protein A2381_16280 [Bdellovibrionales bacterium RIFOXYB1_FULL_37_110]OFZ63157.1 MAG: hypothetical protein A2577_15780 [Bdellovibrionales bacterium RIFOXYD1_FULL_36_51]
MYTAFENKLIIAKGNIEEVVLTIKKRIGLSNHTMALIFDDELGRTIDIDFSGTIEDVRQRLLVFVPKETKETLPGPGRPKLGVISREVSLLPQHWEWLALQRGGASVTLRKLVETAKHNNPFHGQPRFYQDAVSQFMSVIAGDLPNYEEAMRMLYRKDKLNFFAQIKSWPEDVRLHLKKMVTPIFVPDKQKKKKLI